VTSTLLTTRPQTLAGKDSVNLPMVRELAAADHPLHAVAAHQPTSNTATTIVLVLLIAALAIVFWRATLRLIGIAILTLLISGAVMAYGDLHHSHHAQHARHVRVVRHVRHVRQL
jgi:uncharacterized membrane protein YraQ (UPF0718 family)